MTPSPVVSIVLPTFNRIRFLPEAVGSVIAQTFPHWELIVVDDGSTDDTPAFVRSHADPRIRYLPIDHEANIARARNRGLALARGRYVAFLDSDDVWMPHKLEQQIAAMERVPSYRWSYTRATVIDESGRPQPHATDGPWAPRSGWILRELLATEVVVMTPAVLAERSLGAEVGWFDESLRLSEDLDLWTRFAERSAALGLDEVGLKCRVHAERTTTFEWHWWKARVCARVGRRAAQRDVQLLCRRLRVHHLSEFAKHLSLDRQTPAALRALREAGVEGIRHGDWWRQLAKVIARPFGPGRRSAG